MQELADMTPPNGALQPQPDFRPLAKLTALLDEMQQARIAYCHWKSNYHIRYALSGEEDVDLLVEREAFGQFVRILSSHGFKQAQSITSRRQPGVFHFLGNDDATGTLINVHAYARVLTGDHLLKSWALPLEPLLLTDTRQVDGIRLPSKAAELIIFVLRNMLKQTTLLDLYLGRGSQGTLAEECEWLLSDADVDVSLAKLADHFPEIAPDDFLAALSLIRQGGSLGSRVRMGLRFKRALLKYRRYGTCRQAVEAVRALSQTVVQKLFGSRKSMTFENSGMVIALVGPQATGKSTLTREIRRWLGQELSVRVIRSGEPPSTFWTLPANWLIPLARNLFRGQATRSIDKKVDDEGDCRFPYLYIVRKVMLAWERRKLLRKAYQRSRNGHLVLSDRYPSDNRGAIDGASFRPEMIEAQSSRLKRCLMQWETRIYRDICPPDLVLELSVSVEKAVERNQTRDKKTAHTSDYVRQRHAMKHQPRFDHCPVVPISSDRELSETLLDVKKAIWNHL